MFCLFLFENCLIMGNPDLENSATHPFDPEEWLGKGHKQSTLNDFVDEEMDDEGE
jgi:hypothetical protein